MKLSVTIIFLLSFLLEASVTTLPLVFLTLLCLAILTRKEWIFVIAFIAGVVLDVFSFRLLGESSLYFIGYIFLVFLYQRKFEIATKHFVFASSLLGSLGYLLLFSYGNSIILQSISSAIIGTLMFSFLRKFQERKQISNF
ncbi:MAG: rod shape-determining protein MreD [Patescibacteria group bacterium]|nr:rod shape-determining protein MreD [Patescibacteria group bacterium]